ncbi:MAG: hypothetical protein MRERV_39c025 [Mycoplasmataceae bacterium RV_VA103A]|nr:MAG: hypothetical protein MRERV_39c025 [Mycoplasmataceae bacterium RV_VA103A]
MSLLKGKIKGMNRNQNIARKKYKDRISELEIEVSLLRQKLEMIGKICGLNDLASVPVVGEKMATARPIATVWKSGDNVVFQTNNEDDKKYLETKFGEQQSQIESKKEKVQQLEEQKQEIKEDKGDSFAEHLKR